MFMWYLLLTQALVHMLKLHTKPSPSQSIEPTTKGLLPPSQKECRFRFLCHKFDLICRKYVQYLYL